MTAFADLSLSGTATAPYDHASWNAPLLAVGWIEHGTDYLTGYLDTELVDQLIGLAIASRGNFSAINFRGFHDCSLCAESGHNPTLPGSEANLFIPAMAKWSWRLVESTTTSCDMGMSHPNVSPLQP